MADDVDAIPEKKGHGRTEDDLLGLPSAHEHEVYRGAGSECSVETISVRLPQRFEIDGLDRLGFAPRLLLRGAEQFFDPSR
jgi:hypothetical protein